MGFIRSDATFQAPVWTGGQSAGGRGRSASSNLVAQWLGPNGVGPTIPLLIVGIGLAILGAVAFVGSMHNLWVASDHLNGSNPAAQNLAARSVGGILGSVFLLITHPIGPSAAERSSHGPDLDRAQRAGDRADRAG